MPITTLRRSAEANALALLENATGLTMEGQTVVDFLSSLDFSALEDVDGLEEALVEVEDEDGAVAECLPLDVALRLVDHDELAEMFIDYVENMDEGTLEAKARKAVLLSALGMTEDEEDDEGDEDDDLDEAAKGKARAKEAIIKGARAKKAIKGVVGKTMRRGSLKKMRKSKNPGVRDTAIRMLIAMRNKGVIKWKGKQASRGPNYPKATSAGQNKVTKFKAAQRKGVAPAADMATKAKAGIYGKAMAKTVGQAKKGKVKGPAPSAKAARAARGGAKITRKAARFVLPAEESEVYVLGFGEAVDDRLYAASLSPDLTDADLADLAEAIETIDYGEQDRDAAIEETMDQLVPHLFEGADLAGRAVRPING